MKTEGEEISETFELSAMDSTDPDLQKIKKVLHSLDSYDYAQFMKEVHFEYPFKTKDLTDEIVNHWINDHSMKTEDFSKIITEREAEHIQVAQEERQGDLQRIQDLKSRTGLDPLQLFPKEIWMIITKELPLADQRNFRNVHELFHNLTKDTLVGNILLPMMVGIKMERFWGEPYRPELAGTIPQKPLLSPLAKYTELRLVSKTMRNAVDRWFEDDVISKLRSGEKASCPSVVISINLQNPNDFGKFARMKAHLESVPKLIRFFGRSLHIVSRGGGLPSLLRRVQREGGEVEVEQPALEEFPGNIDEILEHIGDQIWYFSFEFNRSMNEPKFAERYTSFLGWLSRMPNLKWLKVTINQAEKHSRYGFSLPEGSPPALSHLERLDLEFKQKNRYILPVCNQLLTAYSHVKILKLVGLKSLLKKKIGFVASGSDQPAKIPLSLEVLILDGSTDDYPEYDYHDREDGSYEDDKFEYDPEDENFNDATLFQSIIQSNWPLRQIDWEMDLRNAFIDGIFHWLGTVKTLEKVRLSLDDVIIRDNSAFLELPQLKHFEFKLKKRVSYDDEDLKTSWRFLYSLQFLLLAKKLETLVWKCDMEKRGWEKLEKDMWNINDLGDILDFDWVALKLLGFTENWYDIEESNIWRVFRGLETVTLELAAREDSTVEKSVSKRYLRRELEFKEKSFECSSSSSSAESEQEL